MPVSCECCVLSGRGFCDGLITHLEENYREWCVVVCGLETSKMMRPWPKRAVAQRKKKIGCANGATAQGGKCQSGVKMGCEMNMVSEKKILLSINCKLLHHIKGNSIIRGFFFFTS